MTYDQPENSYSFLPYFGLAAYGLFLVMLKFSPVREANQSAAPAAGDTHSAQATNLGTGTSEANRDLLRSGLTVKSALRGAYAAGGLFLPFWMILAHPIVDDLRLILHALVISEVLTLAWWLFERRSSSGEGLFSVGGAVIRFLLAWLVASLTYCLNARLDTSPVVTHTVQVLTRSEGAGENSHARYVHVAPWKSGMSEVRLKVSPGFHDSVKPGVTKVVVHTKAGAFGFERVLRVEMVSP